MSLRLRPINMQAQPYSEPSPNRRSGLLVRIVTAGIALGLVLLAVVDRPMVQGEPVFGLFEWAQVAAGVCLGAYGSNRWFSGMIGCCIG